ncbi:aldo/keto reductase [Aspergillus lucknowensis]|uniref:D-xylose reductase [NAD(P)H] n=1 Tax=Aspergillus lucknowensis TaxID=176173 RepID=A0ABR4M352_9EURO
MTTFKLNTGASIPALGFGTWQDAEAQESAVTEALKAGYRHIDTARVYGTEKAVGAAIRKSGIPRSEIFLTTKLWNNKHHPDDVAQALEDSLNDLGLDYVDLYLMHWPVAFQRGTELFPKDAGGKPAVEDVDYLDTYKAMESLLSRGKAKAIGVSNFSQAEMQRLLAHASVPPAVHQLEGHPWLQQRSFADWHKQHNIHVTHYSPFGNQNEIYARGGKIGRMIEDPVLVEVGRKYGKSAAQVALAWGVSEGHSVLPKSKTPERIRANLEGDFKLAAEDVQKIRDIDRKLRFNDSSADFGYSFFEGLDGKTGG